MDSWLAAFNDNVNDRLFSSSRVDGKDAAVWSDS